MPQCSNFYNRISCSTVSKAFLRSINIPHEYNFLANLSCILLTISITVCCVEQFSLKPYCDLEINKSTFKRLDVIKVSNRSSLKALEKEFQQCTAVIAGKGRQHTSYTLPLISTSWSLSTSHNTLDWGPIS